MKVKILLGLFACALVGSQLLQAEEAKKEETAPAAAAPAPVAAPTSQEMTKPLALTEGAIKELQSKKEQLDLREKELEDRARALDMQEKLVKEKLKRMEELNRKMADRLENYKADHEVRIKKLVTMLETMRPQAAASYLENVEPFLAVEVLTRINVEKAAKIMNLVDKKKSARLTELYAGYRDSGEETKAVKEDSKETQQGAM